MLCRGCERHKNDDLAAMGGGERGGGVGCVAPATRPADCWEEHDELFLRVQHCALGRLDEWLQHTDQFVEFAVRLLYHTLLGLHHIHRCHLHNPPSLDTILSSASARLPTTEDCWLQRAIVSVTPITGHGVVSLSLFQSSLV